MTHAIRLYNAGGPEQLRWEEVQVGKPGPGEVRLRHEAIGLNFIDVYHRTGLYPLPLPAIIGKEACGIVEAIGAGVTDVKIGMRVAYVSAPVGAYAEARLVPADTLVQVPDKIGSDIAAAAMLKGLTAHYLIHDCYHVQKGSVILLQAAAGGVGQILSQWASSKGAVVIGVVGNEAKVAEAKQAGCAHVIVTATEDFVTRVKEITGGKGVDAVYDSVGKDTFLRGLDCLKPRGIMVSFGQSSGSVPPFEPGLLSAKGSLFLTRPSLQHYTATAEELRERAAALFDAIASGTVKIKIGARFALKDTADAHRALEARQTMGSVVLVP